MAKNAGSGGDRHPQGSIAGMVMIRLFMGAFFLYGALADKLSNPAKFISYLSDMTGSGGDFIRDNQFPAFARFLENTVHPNANAFGWLIITAELVLGIMLVAGLLTRLAGFGALLLSGAYLLATLHLSASRWAINMAFVVMAVAVIIAAAGRTWGVDAFIARRTRLKLLW